MNPKIVATAEAYINAQVETIKQCMENGVPHDRIIEMCYGVMLKSCEDPGSIEEKNKYLCVLLSRALYHLTNLQIQNRN